MPFPFDFRELRELYHLVTDTRKAGRSVNGFDCIFQDAVLATFYRMEDFVTDLLDLVPVIPPRQNWFRLSWLCHFDELVTAMRDAKIRNRFPLFFFTLHSARKIEKYPVHHLSVVVSDPARNVFFRFSGTRIRHLREIQFVPGRKLLREKSGFLEGDGPLDVESRTGSHRVCNPLHPNRFLLEYVGVRAWLPSVRLPFFHRDGGRKMILRCVTIHRKSVCHFVFDFSHKKGGCYEIIGVTRKRDSIL